jgi:acyl-phosphate glycerol 3-phosphate acyltransferase
MTTTDAILAALIILSAYLIGSVPFGYLIARVRGVDIFRVGSGNIGATNVARALGARFGILVFVLDFGKGAVPTWAAGRLSPLLSAEWQSSWGREGLMMAAGLAAFLGHLFPVYLRFRGGKGVATGAGVVAVLLPGPALGALIIWIGLVAATHTVSLASLGAAAGLCAIHIAETPQPWAGPGRILTVFCLVAMGLVFLRHRANIGRLLHGNENRLKDSPAMLQVSKTLHVLALGLWFGSVIFFTFAALTIFHTFRDLAGSDQYRPAWLSASVLTEDHGTQLAGIAVGPIFDWYFPLQGVCGFLAAATALGWSRLEPGRKVHQIRSIILILALVTVLVGWPVARYVGQLRLERYAPDPAVVQAAQAAFGTWHGISLGLNLATLVLVTVAMALAAQLPGALTRKPDA